MIKLLNQAVKISVLSLLTVVATNKVFAMETWEEQQRRAAMMGATGAGASYPVTSTMTQVPHFTGMQFDPSMMGPGGYPSYHGTTAAAFYPGYGTSAVYSQSVPMTDPRDHEIARLREQLKGSVERASIFEGERDQLEKLSREVMTGALDGRTKLDSEIQRKDKQLEDSEAVCQRLTATVKGLESKNASINEDYTQINRELGVVKGRVQVLTRENSDLRAAFTRSEETSRELHTRLTQELAASQRQTGERDLEIRELREQLAALQDSGKKKKKK